MRSFQALLRFLAPYWLPAILAPLLMVLEVAMDLCQPRLLQTLVDVALPQGDLALVVRLGLLMLGIAIVGFVGGAGCTTFSAIAGLHFATDIRAALFGRIQEWSFGNLDRLETGRLITRLTNDVEQVQEAALMLMRILVRAPLLVVGSLVMAVITSPSLSLLIVVVTPPLLMTFVYLTRRSQALFMAVQNCLDRVNVVMQENLAGVRLVKAFVRSSHEMARFARANDELMARTVQASSLVAGTMPVMALLLNLGVVGVIWIGGLQVHAGKAHVGQVLAFINYLLQMLFSMMMVGMLAARLAQADASAERLVGVLETRPEVQDPADPKIPSSAAGRIEFQQVSFAYDGGEGKRVLRDLTFSVAPGQRVAILGATGCGKTTLLHLIPRLYDVASGRVLVDGIDVREMRQEDLRRRIALVLQEPILFSGSIRDNLRYGRPEASDEEIEAAARIAQAHDFISALPEGYDAILGQRGANLSGGQRQRLAIARALVCRPSILLLDDCTSAVDAATEAAILAALDAEGRRHTRIMVAQRIASVLSADVIMLLEEGTITAMGTHAELLDNCATYQEIVLSQFREREIIHD